VPAFFRKEKAHPPPTEEGRSLCERALVYVKPDFSGDSSEKPLVIPTEEQPVLSNLAPGILTSYLVDRGTDFLYIQNRHLREAGWTEAQLHSRAVENLARFAQGKTKLQGFGGAYAVLLDGNFEASLLAVDSFWERVAAPQVGSDIAAAIPARDILAFCPAGSPQGVAGLREVIARVFPGGDHLITEQVYRRVAGKWTPMPP